jgi:nucleoside-diphosphate kinase
MDPEGMCSSIDNRPSYVRAHCPRREALREQTVALIKPDAVRRSLVGAIINRIECAGGFFSGRPLTIERVACFQFDKALASRFYAEHEQKPFFLDLVKFICGGQSFALVLRGEDAVETWRQLMGPTPNPERKPGQIRYDFAMTYPMMENLMHGSDSPTAAGRERRLLEQVFVL